MANQPLLLTGMLPDEATPPHWFDLRSLMGPESYQKNAK